MEAKDSGRLEWREGGPPGIRHICFVYADRANAEWSAIARRG
jgi:hypothetical protein